MKYTDNSVGDIVEWFNGRGVVIETIYDQKAFLVENDDTTEVVAVESIRRAEKKQQQDRPKWHPLPLNVHVMRAAGGFVKARVQPSRHDSDRFIAMVNQELVGGPSASYSSASEARNAADTYVMTKLRAALLEYSMLLPVAPEATCELSHNHRYVVSQGFKSPCPACRDIVPIK